MNMNRIKRVGAARLPKTIRLMASLLIVASCSPWILTSCGRRDQSDDPSYLEFIRSRAGSQRYAYIEQKDVQDVFIFGGSVIKTNNFQSGALNMVLRPMKVKLRLSGASSISRKLDVVTADGQELVMSFSAAVKAQKYEVDFASAGNDLNLRSLIQTVGGMYTAESNDGMWVSQGAPRVLSVLQDADTMVVDLEHTVQQAKTATDAFGRVRISEILSAKPGQVVVRIYLRRQKSLPSIGGAVRTVANAKSLNIGFFGPDLNGAKPLAPIQRFNIGDTLRPEKSVTYYLKDVPLAFQAVAKQAITSWNTAFGSTALSVEIAPPGVDAGDPRYHVVKWFDGTDNSLAWAGVAKMIVDPDSGLVMSGTLYVQGDTLIKLYGDIVSYTEAVSRQPSKRLVGKIGNIDFSNDDGEKPVIPFLTDTAKNFDSYMQGYYLETIAHEVGHTLGLRHNFRGSTALIANESASVMDYAPRGERDHYAGPGFYDVAAIRYGYFGESPKQKLPFCTDEDIANLYDCSQGDWGDPVKNAVRSLIDSTMLLAQKPVTITRDEQISSVTGALENALKIKRLSSQIPADKRAEVIANIDAARDYLYTAKPDSALTGADLAIVNSNLAKMRDLAKKKELSLQKIDI